MKTLLNILCVLFFVVTIGCSRGGPAITQADVDRAARTAATNAAADTKTEMEAKFAPAQAELSERRVAAEAEARAEAEATRRAELAAIVAATVRAEAEKLQPPAEPAKRELVQMEFKSLDNIVDSGEGKMTLPTIGITYTSDAIGVAEAKTAAVAAEYTGKVNLDNARFAGQKEAKDQAFTQAGTASRAEELAKRVEVAEANAKAMAEKANAQAEAQVKAAEAAKARARTVRPAPRPKWAPPVSVPPVDHGAEAVEILRGMRTDAQNASATTNRNLQEVSGKIDTLRGSPIIDCHGNLIGYGK